MKLPLRVARVDIVVAPGRLTAVAHSGAVSRSETVRLDGMDAAAVLPAAFATLRARLDAAVGADLSGVRVAIALLPPLAEARLIALPPLRPAEAEAVVRRDGGRYFMGVTAPRVVAVEARRAAGAPVFAAAAPAALVEALHTAAAGAGWRVAAITAAHNAWLAAARGTAATAVVAVHDGTAHVLRLDDGVFTALRRVPAAATAESVAAAGAADGPGSVLLLADGATGGTLAAAFAAAGWTRTGAHTPAVDAAARHAAATRLRFLPSSVLLERSGAERRVALRLAAAAVLLLVAAAAVELWGAGRELDALRGRRADIRAAIAPLLAVRDSIDRLDTRTLEIEAAAGTAPRWTDALLELSLLLPPETHLTRLYATGDTLTIDGAGERAGAALQALRTAGSLRDARLLGTVDRELADGATALERFRITARLSGHAGAAALAARDGGAQ
jgi:Tfp pilus assembly protein PilN